MWRHLVLLGLLCAVCVHAQMYDEHWRRFSRRSNCIGSGGGCFSTHECCDSFVCAAVDTYADEPEVPGVCMKEKDLRECSSSIDCPNDKACVPLLRTTYRYCIPRQHIPAQRPQYNALRTGNRRLGTQCSESAECMEDLCCQKVRRGRQGTRQICDRITAISKCLTK